MERLLDDPEALVRQIRQRICRETIRAPDPDLLPIVPGLLDEGYINGRDQKS